MQNVCVASSRVKLRLTLRAFHIPDYKFQIDGAGSANLESVIWNLELGVARFARYSQRFIVLKS